MVGAGESAPAHEALEGSLAGVLPGVTGQLVASGELPSAAFPGAVEGLLTWRRGGGGGDRALVKRFHNNKQGTRTKLYSGCALTAVVPRVGVHLGLLVVSLLAARVLTLVDGGVLLGSGVGRAPGTHGSDFAAVVDAPSGARRRGHERRPLLCVAVLGMLRGLRVILLVLLSVILLELQRVLRVILRALLCVILQELLQGLCVILLALLRGLRVILLALLCVIRQELLRVLLLALRCVILLELLRVQLGALLRVLMRVLVRVLLRVLLRGLRVHFLVL